MILNTPRLILRPFAPEDIDAVLRIWGDADVMRFCGGAGTLEQLEKAIARFARVQKDGGLSVYAAVRKEDGALIGACGFHAEAGPEEAELIYHFAPPYWGRGYATEAAAACIAHARANTNLLRIVASTAPEHAASQAVLKKLGFAEAGTQWYEDVQREDLCFALALRADTGEPPL